MCYILYHYVSCHDTKYHGYVEETVSVINTLIQFVPRYLAISGDSWIAPETHSHAVKP